MENHTDNLARLFKLLEITRSQPQYGYALAGISKNEQSDLAQHHYLVAVIAWQLARRVKAKGADIAVEKVLELALVHDLGELFGGDIAMPYARANPKARNLAKAFEAENQKFLSGFFGSERDYFLSLTDEILEPQSDEGLIAKLADYIEVAHYKEYVGKFTAGDITMSFNAMVKKIEKIHDPVARHELGRIAEEWKECVTGQGSGEFFEQEKI